MLNWPCGFFTRTQEYGRGSAADCRNHVKKLNAMRGREDIESREQVEEVDYEENQDLAACKILFDQSSIVRVPVFLS
jgi:hypothetical protein